MKHQKEVTAGLVAGRVARRKEGDDLGSLAGGPKDRRHPVAAINLMRRGEVAAMYQFDRWLLG